MEYHRPPQPLELMESVRCNCDSKSLVRSWAKAVAAAAAADLVCDPIKIKIRVRCSYTTSGLESNAPDQSAARIDLSSRGRVHRSDVVVGQLGAAVHLSTVEDRRAQRSQFMVDSCLRLVRTELNTLYERSKLHETNPPICFV